MVVARATRCLLSQLHVNLLELSAFPVFGEDGEDAQRLPAPDVTDLGKKYIAEIHICAGELDKEEAAATSSAQAAALRAERQRTEWAACITELALLVFVQRPAVLGELLARWWYRHLCDPRCEDEELPRLSGLAQPDADPQFWPAVHTLVAQGLPERAVQLLQLHPALRGGADGAGLSAAEAGLLVRLEALLEEMPRLAHPDLVGTPQPEASALMHQQQLADFQASWRVWAEDVAALRSDAAAATAAGAPVALQVQRVCEQLAGGDSGIAELDCLWHRKLVAALLYQRPTLLRWQVHELLGSCLGAAEEAALSPYERVLLATLRDDPFATIEQMRADEAFGEGWLVAHLWDLLCRAGRVPPGPEALAVPSLRQRGLTLRQHFLLQHAMAIADGAGLWQLGAGYAALLMRAPAGCDAARQWLGALLLRQLDHPAAHATHALKVRKLLQLCELHDLPEIGKQIAAASARLAAARRPPAAAAATPAAALTLAAAAPPEVVAAQLDARAAAAARLSALAERALHEAIAAAAPPPPVGGAAAELRGLLRSSGTAGANYYAGPPWLPTYFELLELVAALRAHGAAERPEAQRQAQQARLRQLLVELCEMRDDGAAAPPPRLLLALLQLLTPEAPFGAALGLAAAPPPPAVASAAAAPPPPPLPAAPPAFSAAACHELLAQAEDLKASKQLSALSTRHGEAADCRPHALRPAEQLLSRSLTQHLAAAILHEAGSASRNSVWGVGI